MKVGRERDVIEEVEEEEGGRVGRKNKEAEE